MPPAIEVNRHRGLGLDELTRKYRDARDAEHEDEGIDPDDYCDDYDDCWDPQRGRTADDYLVLGSLEESIGFAIKRPKLGELLPGAVARPASDEAAPVVHGDARPRHAPAELAEALAAHVERILSRARHHEFAYGDELEGALVRINGGTRGVEEALRRFEDRPGPIVMALLFTPFWVRPLASWSPPEGDDAAVIRSLIAHLFQIYPVPRALLEPWLANGLPSLKWVSWFLLLGQGGTLHRAARRFGWSIGKRFTHHLATAPDDLTALEACMWAEIARLGGDRVEFDRIRRDPAFAIDPTEGLPDEPEDDDERAPASEWERERIEASEAARVFWRQTVAWLIRWRAELTDDTCGPILEWAMHEHTEALRGWPTPRPPFTWRGREPAATLTAALEYRRRLALPYGDMTWNARGMDWDLREGEEIVWTVRELTSSRALFDESHAMHHCVASYAHRCARGQSAIFSLCIGAVRRITVELDPFGHRIVQARGACNRAATAEEQAVLARWLVATSPGRQAAARAP